ncbi:MAG TPA: response regulator transcription factor [Rhizomicrobium sp.]
MTRILVVDDHAIVRSGIRRLLAERPHLQVSDVASGEEALVEVGRAGFDLLVLDLNLPGLGGLELLRRLLRLAPRLPVLVFSLHTEAIYATRALEAGARGFVSKNATPEELLAAVDTVLAGGTAIEKDIAHEIATHDLADDAYLRPLTQRDLEILRLLAEGKNLSQIATALGIAYKTVANTLSRIKEKLGVEQTADLIRLAIGRGLTDLTS